MAVAGGRWSVTSQARTAGLDRRMLRLSNGQRSVRTGYEELISDTVAAGAVAWAVARVGWRV
jgi:hypothetical protein